MNNNIYSVSQINNYIKKMFARDGVLNNVSIKGEITECNYHSSGHIYFTLKDKDTGAQMHAVMWRSARINQDFDFKEGDKVVATGRLDVYDVKGQYQLVTTLVELAGVGELFLQRKKLKEKLEAEGLFDIAHKKSIPGIIRTLGIITGRGSRAEGDFKRGLMQRDPGGYIRVTFMYAPMEGAGAAGAIADAIRRMDALGLDAMIVGRGGGASETLWSFDDEEVVRAVYSANTPIISAVGHDMDVPVIDFAADVRAGTPSFAIEKAIIITYDEIKSRLVDAHADITGLLLDKIEKYRDRLKYDSVMLEKGSPAQKIKNKKQRIESLRDALKSCMKEKTGACRTRLLMTADREKLKGSLERKLNNRKRVLEISEAEIKRLMKSSLTDTKNRFKILAGSLESASPVAKIAGGYAYVSDSEDKKISSVKSLSAGDRINMALRDGVVGAEVTDIEEKDIWTM